MRTIMLLMGVVAAGCGGKGDDCQRFVDKSKPVLQGMGKELGGKELGDKELAQMVEMCRKSDKVKSDPVIKCVLDAKDETAVRECYGSAFGDYLKKGKKTEAQLQLNKLGKNAKVEYLTNSQFPKGKTGPMPAKPCCEGPNHKCPVEQWMQDPVWASLDFSVDEPHLFQYTYESDGQTAKATAIGDLDCDGTTITYTLEATVRDGNPEIKVTEPAPGVD